MEKKNCNYDEQQWVCVEPEKKKSLEIVLSSFIEKLSAAQHLKEKREINSECADINTSQVTTQLKAHDFNQKNNK